MDSSQLFPVQNGYNYSAAHLGRFAELSRYRFTVPMPGGKEILGKIFLKEQLGLTGVEMSYNTFPPGAGMPFLHAHRENEEVYLFIAGQGEFQVDGESFSVSEGSVVRVAPGGARAYRNVGSAPLHFIVLQVKENSLAAVTVEDGIMLEGQIGWPS